jgi:hypothetical protein
MTKKKLNRERVSNRTYPPKLCKKQDCNLAFVPTDGRQVYCNAQHRIDSNNDKRKITDKIESDFNKGAKNNKRILIKIHDSKEYLNSGVVNKSLLAYEGYDFNIYHKTLIHKIANREVKFCFDYGLMLEDTKNNNYKILKDVRYTIS